MDILVPLLFLLQSQILSTTFLELPSSKNMLKFLILKACSSHLTLHTNLVLTLSLLQPIKKKNIHIFHIYTQLMLKTKFILNPTHRKLFITLFNRHFRSRLKPPTMKLCFLLHLIHFLIRASIPPLIFSKSI